MRLGIAKTEGLLLTRTGYMAGHTVFAPEQVKGAPLTAPDVCSFSVLLYELITGIDAISAGPWSASSTQC
jgi:hypothetical protein